MSERKFTLKEFERILTSQYNECVELMFFREFKNCELQAEDIPDLLEIVDLIHRHEKVLAKNRQEIEIKILNYRMNQLMPDNNL